MWHWPPPVILLMSTMQRLFTLEDSLQQVLENLFCTDHEVKVQGYEIENLTKGTWIPLKKCQFCKYLHTTIVFKATGIIWHLSWSFRISSSPNTPSSNNCWEVCFIFQFGPVPFIQIWLQIKMIFCWHTLCGLSVWIERIIYIYPDGVHFSLMSSRKWKQKHLYLLKLNGLSKIDCHHTFKTSVCVFLCWLQAEF